MIRQIIAAQQNIKVIDPTTTTNLPKSGAVNGTTFHTLFTTAFVIIGAVGVLMIVIAGLRYVISGGDETKMATAKRSIIHIAVGLVVAGMAYTIVSVVLGRV